MEAGGVAAGPSCSVRETEWVKLPGAVKGLPAGASDQEGIVGRSLWSHEELALDIQLFIYIMYMIYQP